MKQSRREFLIRTTCAGLSAAAAQASLRRLGLMNLYARPKAPTDYRALVCIFMDGGNDSNNLVVPRDSYYTNQYAIARPANSGLQIPLGSLLPVNNPPSLGGRSFGFHPSLADDPVTFYPGLASLYNAGKLAVVSNIGRSLSSGPINIQISVQPRMIPSAPSWRDCAMTDRQSALDCGRTTPRQSSS